MVAKRRGATGEGISWAAFDDWTEEDKLELSTVLAAIGESIASSPTPSCVLASYLSLKSCIDVAMAITQEKIMVSYTMAWSSGRSSGHLPSPELPDSDSNMTGSLAHKALLDRHKGKKRKKDHEDARQKDVASGHRYVNPFDDAGGDVSAAEMRMRVPRAVLPWSPCHHPGKPCSSFTGKEDSSGEHCTCRKNGTWCEPGCGCPVDCSERFPGCECGKEGKECKIGSEDAKGNRIMGCPCQEHFRECHVEICAGHDEKKCRLMSLQDDRAIVSQISYSFRNVLDLFTQTLGSVLSSLQASWKATACSSAKTQINPVSISASIRASSSTRMKL